MSTTLILYTTAGCHLCEQAADLLDTLAERHPLRVEPVDIAGDEKLVELYGERIPVVRRADSDVEIGWPFGLQQLRQLL